jgi:hypothetical protein
MDIGTVKFFKNQWDYRNVLWLEKPHLLSVAEYLLPEAL